MYEQDDSSKIILSLTLLDLLFANVGQCQEHCVHNSECQHWTFNSDLVFGYCRLFISISAEKSGSGYSKCTSGPKYCTQAPTLSPTMTPTVSPSDSPTSSPTLHPSVAPTASPTVSPTLSPTSTPTSMPTNTPTDSPTYAPTSDKSSSTYCITEDVMYKGGKTVKSIKKVGNAEDCHDECLAYEACEGFTWRQDGLCKLLKNNYVMKTNQDKFTSGPRECPLDDECEVQFKDYIGGDTLLTMDDIESAAKCAQECNNLSPCTTWTYRTDLTTCYLRRKSTKAKSRNAYYVTGTKSDCASYGLPTTDAPTSAPTMSPIASVLSCSSRANDIVFILDSSGSIDSKQFEMVKNFVRQLGSAFQLGSTEEDSRLAMIQFDSDATLVWGFDDSRATSLSKFSIAVDALEDTSSGTGVGAALITAQDLFEETAVRTGLFRRIAIIFTDGKANKNTLCKANGYPTNAKKCVKSVAEDLRKGVDGIEGTDDDVYLAYIRVGTKAKTNLFGNLEDLRVDTYPDVITDVGDYIISELCDIED